MTAAAFPLAAVSKEPVIIEMKGTARGERVWYTPLGIHVPIGETLRFVNRDAGNVHTVTAFHPEYMNLPRRIPDSAEVFNSDYLQPDAHWDLTLTTPGIYDYFCIPHLRAGMVGRIVVGSPQQWVASSKRYSAQGIPQVAIDALPSVETILANQSVRME